MSAAVLVVRTTVGGAVLDAVLMMFAVLVVFAVLVTCSVFVHSCAVLRLAGGLLWQALTLHVSLDPEVGEEHKEEGSIHPDKVEDDGELVVTAVHEVILSGMDGHQDKLDL